ncbi:hypothetical protein NLU13_4085 [Sarocladium strictum]|uniref:Zn(2)-C6 fungal-type domain-containing protein n=1 Tax=Sarocladium strictum TaxID=5046 RepID=A0AA39GI85_SARSR|nr:hypothetical protein NLU13_4085 [Sarocladium strictum]
MRKRPRAILPYPGEASSSSRPTSSTTDGEIAHKRRAVRVACNTCRNKKTACDGGRPSCARCLRGNSICQYASANPEETPQEALRRQIDQLQDNLAEHAEFLQRLRSASDPEALSIVRRLRATPNISPVLSSLRGSAHTATRLSELRVLQGVLLTQAETEIELSVLHSSVYPLKLPLDFDSIDMESLFSPEKNPSPLVVDTQERSRTSTRFSVTPDRSVFRPPALRGTTSQRQSPMEGPVTAPQYCDSRLERLDISYWTSIPITNTFAASVLSYYFEFDHPIYACVDADVFIDDLVERRLGHCSAFLVSALMAFACQSYTQFDRRSSALSAAFMEEAQKLLRSERRSQTSDHLAALTYLALAAGCSGSDELGVSLAAECHALAKRLKLLGVRPSDDLALEFHSLPLNDLKSWAAAAWGAYAWLTYRSIFYPEPPIPYPPLLPIPGDRDRDTDYGSTLTWPTHELPAYMGETFQTLSKLWVIIQEINILYVLTDEEPLTQRVPLSYAETKYQALLHLADTLLPSMLPTEQSAAHVLFFHALYHSTVLTLFYPFQVSANNSRIRSLSSIDAYPSSIYNASLNQLKHLVYGYYAREQRLATQCWFNTAILRVSTEIVKNSASDPDWFFYFRLCFKFWKDAYICYRPFRHIAQANLAAALEYGVLTSDTATAMIEEITALGQHHVAVDEAEIGGLFDVNRGPQSIENSKIASFAKRFEELRLFDELTTGDFESTLRAESD